MRAMTIVIPVFLASLPAAAQDQSKTLAGTEAVAVSAHERHRDTTGAGRSPAADAKDLPPAVRKEED